MVVSVHVTWPNNELAELEKIKKLAGHDNLSKLIRQLLQQWVSRQEHILAENPIGLRYETPEVDSKHWIDTLTQNDVQKIREDINIVENIELLGKLKATAFAIKQESDNRSMELWRMEKMKKVVTIK